MKNKYKTEYNKIKLTQQQKNILISKMQEVETEKKILNFSRKTFTRAIAACLAIAVICTGFFFTKSTPKNSFTIIANAAEVQSLPDDAIGIFSVDDPISAVTYDVTDGTPELTGAMRVFGLTEFSVQGSNIKSIAVHSNNKNRSILADTVIDSPDFDAEKYNIDKFSIGNSVKAEEGFIYENKNISAKTQTFKFDNLASYAIIPDLDDPEVSEYIKREDELNRKGMEIEDGIDSNGKKLTQAEINKIDRKLTEESCKLARDYNEKMLRDATVDVTITFADDTIQTKTLDVDLVIKDEEGNIIFDEKYDDYSSFEYNSTDCGINIVFRYAE